MTETETTILVKRIQTEDGIGQVDYDSLANLPVIDDALKIDSINAIQNKAVATAFNNVSTAVNDVSAKVDTVKNEFVNGDITVNNSTNFNGQPASYYAALNTQGISTYTHSKSGTVHNFVGTGNNGKAKMTADVAAGDTFTVNGQSVNAYCGAETATDAMAGEAYNGKWVIFVFDGAQLNFKGGGGLSNTKLARATATANDVLSGKTFYSNENGKNINSGTVQSMGETTITLDAEKTGHTFYTKGKYCTGNMNVVTNTKGEESITLNPGGSYTFATSGKLCTGNMAVTVNSVGVWPMRVYCPYNHGSNTSVDNVTDYLPLPDGDGTYYIYLQSADIQSTSDAKHFVSFQGETWVNNTNNGGNYSVHPDWYKEPHLRNITSSNRTINYTWRYCGTICFVYYRVA